MGGKALHSCSDHVQCFQASVTVSSSCQRRRWLQSRALWPRHLSPVLSEGTLFVLQTVWSTSVDEHGEADWVWGKAQERCAASLTQQTLGVDGITIRSHGGHKLFLYTDEKWSFHLRRVLVASMFTLDWWGKCSDVLFGYEISFNPWRPQSS